MQSEKQLSPISLIRGVNLSFDKDVQLWNACDPIAVSDVGNDTSSRE